MSRLILVSNRLPVTLRRGRSGDLEIVRSSGGLVSALEPIHRDGDGLWIGNPGAEATAEVMERLTRDRFISVPVSAAETRAYYQGYANGALWPLFHYLPERCRFNAAQFDVYRRVNERFADCVARHANEDDLIWVHDYLLMLVPEMLRERLPRAQIGFFLHTPFPSSEVFRLLPQREDVLRGLLGANVIGLHTYDYARHLVSSMLRVLGIQTREGVAQVDGRQVQIATHPIGIDVKAMRDVAFSRAANNRLQELRRMMGDRRMILGVERLDYTKGIPLKLAAFEHLLETSPHWRTRIVFVQVVVPSREGIASYREQREQVEQLVGRINGEYGQPGRVPIHYIYRSIPQAELGALYRAADVGFVLPIRDGMNLVAKEFVACQDNGHGVLVLSEFAGAASELGEALRVNPWDVESTAAALEQALEMEPSERRARMSAMSKRISANDVHLWVRRALTAIARPAPSQIRVPRRLEPEDLAAEIRPSLEAASSPAFLLDYDGTLREFTVHPEDAAPTPGIMRILERISRRPGAHVVIISGRDRGTLSRWFDGVPIAIVAEHGAWTRLDPNADWQPGDTLLELGWMPEVRAVLDEYAQRTPGASVEEKTAAIVWHYRAAEEDLGRWQARELSAHLREYLANEPAEVIEGAKLVEIRQQGITKGNAYQFVVSKLGPFDFELAIGDDTTDEDLFAALGESAFTIHVGDGPSRARACVGSPAEARALLRALVPSGAS